MRIQVNTLTGKSAEISLQKENSTVETLSSKVQEVFGIPLDQQKLIFNNQKLSEGSLSVYGLSEDSNSNIVYMLVDIDGGKGKKKKKKTKKPKKPHRNKKVNLAILKYFKIEDGEVVRLKQKSEAGTFLAEHKDRYYCGKLHTNYKKTATDTTSKPAASKETKAPAAKGGKGKKN